MLRSLFYIVIVWVVWRWLDRVFGGRKRNPSSTGFGSSSTTEKEPNIKKKPNDDRIGDYVDFEEVED